MGLVFAELTLGNLKKPELTPIKHEALVDSGALHLCIPQHVALQLDLEEIDRREIVVADGSRHRVAYVGPILLKVANRQCLAGAMVIGEQILLGAIQMEDIDLVVRPSMGDVIPNPLNPNIAVSYAMGVRHPR
ncbi:MAG: hypothetical protein ACRC7C_07975 [Beijerinckiaceae bacterium]